MIWTGVHLYVCMNVYIYVYIYICIYIYVYIYVPPKSLNGTLVVDLPFQTLAVDFLFNLWTRSTTARSRNNR